MTKVYILKFEKVNELFTVFISESGVSVQLLHPKASSNMEKQPMPEMRQRSQQRHRLRNDIDNRMLKRRARVRQASVPKTMDDDTDKPSAT